MRAAFFFLSLVLIINPLIINAQDSDSGVIGRYVAAVGGKANWDLITTIKSSGEYDYGGIKFPFSTISKAPNRYKMIVPFNGKYYEQAFDGKKGWKIDAFKNETKPTLLSGSAAKALANEAEPELENVFFHYKTSGKTFSLEADTLIDGLTCSKLRVSAKNSSPSFYYFDKATGDMIMSKSVSKNEELKGAVLTTRFSDYRFVERIKIPFKTVHSSNGQMILSIIIEKVTLNEPVNDLEFQFK